MIQGLIRVAILGLTCVALFGCSGGLPSGPSETHRGEADAIDPARNVSIVQSCESKKGDATVNTSIVATNNCDKHVDNTQASQEPVVVEPKVVVLP